MQITLPWIVRRRSVEKPVVVMASRFELTSTTAVPRFMYLALRAYVQALRTQGVVGVSLKAAPWSGRFWTLSSWVDRKALATYSQSQPHARIMASLRPVTSSSRFVFFDGPGSAPPTWSEAMARLAAADAEAGAGEARSS
jgi:hypothetical protein